MMCPLKPGLTCNATSSEIYGTPCPGCTAGRANGRYAASGDLPLCEPLAALRQQLRERISETAPQALKNNETWTTGSSKSKYFLGVEVKALGLGGSAP